MATTDTVEGTLGANNSLWFHYDIRNDVLYVRSADARELPCYGDEQPDGTLLLRRQDNDEAVGLTIVNWWKHYGTGHPVHTLEEIASAVEPWSKSIAA
jgi:hypothetical protein